MDTLNNLQRWLLYTPLGRHVLRSERNFYRNTVDNLFGYYSLQIGLPQINFLLGNQIPNHYVLGSDINCDLRFLPIASNSIDLIICPHTLEFTHNYHHLLQECYRILIPEGKLIITSFNKSSLLYWFGHKEKLLTKANFVNLNTLKQQLNTLNFRIDGGNFFNYLPPLNNVRHLSYLSWLNKVGNRWFPTMANNYALVASKEVVTHTLVGKVKEVQNPKLQVKLGTNKICKQ